MSTLPIRCLLVILFCTAGFGCAHHAGSIRSRGRAMVEAFNRKQSEDLKELLSSESRATLHQKYQGEEAEFLEWLAAFATAEGDLQYVEVRRQRDEGTLIVSDGKDQIVELPLVYEDGQWYLHLVDLIQTSSKVEEQFRELLRQMEKTTPSIGFDEPK